MTLQVPLMLKKTQLTPKSLLLDFCDEFYGRRIQNNSISTIEFGISMATRFF